MLECEAPKGPTHMPQSFVSNNIHIAFSTKGREKLIPPGRQKKLWGYMAGITKNLKATPMAIGGMEDHAHLRVALPSDLDIATYVNKVKANSSKWVNENEGGFAWQKGSGAFSVSASNLAVVTQYIETQATHHKKMDSREEFLALLKRHGVPFDPQYVE